MTRSDQPARRNTFRGITRLGVLAGLILCSASTARAQANGEESLTFVVVVNLDSPVRNISSSDVTGLLLGAKRYLGRSDRSACIVLPPAEAGLTTALLDALDISMQSYAQAWRRVAFSSNPAQPPREMASNVDVAMIVYRISHCVGFLAIESGSTIPDRWRQHLIVLDVDGRSPDDEDYPLLYRPDG